MKRYLNKHLGTFLVLILLSTSMLSASHVHDSAHLHNDQIEQCLAYHVADHQQSAHIHSFDFGEVLSYQILAVAFQTIKQQGVKKPPARAPPLTT